MTTAADARADSHDAREGVPTIPTCADFTSATVVETFDDMVAPPGLTNHVATVGLDHDVLAVRSLNVPPISQGDCVTGRLYLDGALAQAHGQPVTTTWRPDRVSRSTLIDGVRVRTTTVCPPGLAGVVVRIEVSLEGGVGAGREVRLGVWCDSTVTRSDSAWLAAEPAREGNALVVRGARRVGVPDGRVVGAAPGGQDALVREPGESAGAVSVQGLVDEEGGDVATLHERPRLIETSLALTPGRTWRGAYVHVLDVDEETAGAAFAWAAADVDGAVAASERVWDEEFTAVFTPGNDLYGGHLPVLRASNEALRRLYWWGAMGVAWFRRDNPASVLGRTYDTLMPRHWQTVTFIWDYSLSSQVHALLDPGVMRRQVLHWIGLDIDRHFGTEWLTGGPVGYWYSVNHYAMTRLLHDYLTLHGDHAILDEVVTLPDGRSSTVAECVLEWARAWESRRGASGLADYGGIDNLLECVSSYTHEVASLNAANVWCLRTAAEICAWRGGEGGPAGPLEPGDGGSALPAEDRGGPAGPVEAGAGTPVLPEHSGERGGPAGPRDAEAWLAEAASLRAEADALVPLVLDLYRDGEGCFDSRQPDGTRAASRHCYDLSTVGTTIAGDLAESQRGEMVDFFTRELRTPSWMRALSASDDDAGFSVRPDHQWNGAYPAWPADTARAVIELGGAPAVAEWLEGLARTTRQGPPGQAHFVEEAAPTVDGGARKAPAQWPYLIDWACSSAGAWCELVISGIFGVRVGLDGEVTQAPSSCVNLVDPDASLEGLRVQGQEWRMAASGAARVPK